MYYTFSFLIDEMSTQKSRGKRKFKFKFDDVYFFKKLYKLVCVEFVVVAKW